MRKFNTLFLLLIGIIFSSCSLQMDDDWDLKDSGGTPMQSFSITFEKSSLQALEAATITEIGIYVYKNDSLVFGKDLPLKDGIVQVEVPLGETLQTFAVANGGRIENADSLSKVIVYQDEFSPKEIFVTDVVSFVSDKSTRSVNIELKRAVGELIFRPLEDETTLLAITDFDELNVVFNNVGVGYRPMTADVIKDTVTINSKLDQGFIASFYSFPTLEEAPASIEVAYFKDGVEVNSTLRALEAAINIEASKRTIVNMPILDGDYLEKSFPINPRFNSVGFDKLLIEELEF